MSKNNKKALEAQEQEQFLDFLGKYSAQAKARQEEGNRRGTINRLAKENIFFELFTQALERYLPKTVNVPKYDPKSKKSPTDRILNVMWSDLHFGANLDEREVGSQYGSVEEARRMAAIVQQTASYKPQYRKNTELYIHLLGDVIQGQLHDARDGAALAEQMARSIHILVHAVAFLSSQFKKVSVFCTTGNHGRNTSRHKDRAVNQKWDSNETIIYYAVKTAVASLPNVTVTIPMTPYYEYEAFGMRGFMTHGDTVLKPGFPNKSINVAGLHTQVNDINSKHSLDKRFSLFGCGHVHVASDVTLPNGEVVVTNGALIPADAYAKSIGIMSSTCCQQMWETVPGIMFGDHRRINVNEKTDKDATLDKIIPPFKGL